MPTIHGTISTTTDVDIYKPPEDKKIVLTMVRFVNSGTATVTLTLKQVDPIGNAKELDEITLAAGQEFGMALDNGVYDLDVGAKLVGVLNTNGVVKYTLTYRLV